MTLYNWHETLSSAESVWHKFENYVWIISASIWIQSKHFGLSCDTF